MAEFTSSPQVDPSVDPLLYTTVQRNSLANIGMQQDQANQAAFRAAAPGLVARDPTATGQALGANPTATTGYLGTVPALDANTRAQSAAEIQAGGSLTGAALNAPPDQRQAVYEQGRQQLAARGYNLPPYSGDGGLITLRGQALTAQEQLALQNQVMTFGAPQSPLQSIPGGTAPQGQPAQGASGPRQAITGGGYNGALMASESSGNPSLVNPQGYAGLYQFGAARLTDLGMYQPAPGENVGANQWQGTFNIPGYPQVKTLADFRANVSAQQAVQQASLGNIDSVIAQTPGAQSFDQNGLRAVAHLGGIGGMQRFVATGGRYDPADANGTHLSDYYRKFSGGGQQQATPVPQATAPAPVAQGAPQPAQPAPAPTQTASTTGTAGLPATATDATGGAPPQQDGLTDTLARFRAQVPKSLADPQRSTGPGQPIGPSPAAPSPAPASQAPSPGQNQLAAIGAGAQPQAGPAQTPAAGQNPMATIGAAAAPQQNALSSIGQPQPGSQGAPAVPQGAAPPQQTRPWTSVGNPLYLQPGEVPGMIGGRLAPVPGLDGFVYVRRNGVVTPVRLPTAPGTGIKTEITPSGDAVSTDNQDPTRITVTPGVVPQSGRLTSANDGRGGKLMIAPSGQVMAQTPSNTGHDLQMQDYTRDQTLAQQAADELVSARQADFAIREQRGITAGLTQTGAYGERKAQLASYLESTFGPDTAKAFERVAGLDDASQSEQFRKIALAASGAQENANVGARGGFQLTRLYTQANPGLGSQPNTIRDIQNLQAVSNLSQQDYLQGLIGYINQNSDSARAGGPYNPSTKFSHDWNAGTNPQVYVAAAEALNQKPYAKWSRGLSPQDQARALSIAARADNTASYIGPNGLAALTPYGASQSPASQQQGAAQPQQPTQQPQQAVTGGVPAWAAAALRQHPEQAAAFDAKFGPGASRGVLAQ